jgi:CBS domain-containing protein/anti-sigma regulatory factor (Ser/Thr protein kinase)
MTSSQQLQDSINRPLTEDNIQDITRVEELSYDLKVSDVMSTDIKTVTPDMPMSYVLELLRVEHISGAPVVTDNRLIGIVSLEDLIRAMSAFDTQAPVAKYMTHKVITLHSYDPVVEAIERFTISNLGRMPVVDESEKLVGMITKGDITRGVLIALQKDYQAEEIRRYRASHLFEDINSDRTSLILRYHIKPKDFTHGGTASSNIKRALLRLGANPKIARRCGIAIYEAEMNLIIHTTNGGSIRVEIEPHQIVMKTTDDGPGIADIEKAMKMGYSTASEAIRELGFGAGMGLNNIRRCVDAMDLTSTPGKGTNLEMKIFLDQIDSFRETSYFDEEKTANEIG